MNTQHKVTFESTRIPIDCSIDLRFNHFKGFEEHYAANISMGGIFIRTPDLHPPGTQFELCFQLEDGQPLIRGTAEVVWRRAEDRGPDRPSGIGARFLHLDLESKYVIYRMVDCHIQHGGTPFDLEGDRQIIPVAGSAAAKRSLGPFLAFGLAALLLIAAGSLGYMRFAAAPDEAPSEPQAAAESLPENAAPENIPPEDIPPDAATAASGAEPVAGESSSVAAETDAEPAITEPEAATSQAAKVAEAVEATVDAWAHAWAEKDVAAYLASYTPDYTPPSGMSHAAWTDERQARLSRPGPIAIEISNLEVETPAPDRARARFDQAYSSATYRDRVRKSLELVYLAEGWRIVREEVVTADPP